MRILTARDASRLNDAVRKVERMVELNRQRRYPVLSGLGSGDGLIWPETRKDITAATVQLTRDDIDTLLWWNDPTAMYTGLISLPTDPVAGDTFWLAMFIGDTVAIRPQRDQAILAPFGYNATTFPLHLGQRFDLILGYWFDYYSPGGSQKYESQQCKFNAIASGGSIVTWFVIQYTGETVQIPTGYIDNNGNGEYETGDELIYSTVNIWDTYKWSGGCPGIEVWKTDINPY